MTKLGFIKQRDLTARAALVEAIAEGVAAA